MCIEIYNDKQLKQLMRLMGVADIIAFAIGAFTPLKEASDSIMNKIRRISVEISPEFRQELGFSKLNLFCEHFFQTIKVNT